MSESRHRFPLPPELQGKGILGMPRDAILTEYADDYSLPTKTARFTRRRVTAWVFGNDVEFVLDGPSEPYLTIRLADGRSIAVKDRTKVPKDDVQGFIEWREPV